MNCEKAEDYLSAYLDDMLDAQLSREIGLHLTSCANCRETLADYRRFDHLLAVVPRVEPAEELRARVFESADFAALLSKQQHTSSRSRDAALGHQPEPPLPVGEPHPIESAQQGETQRQKRSPRHGSPPKWSRVALQSAAVLALVLGSALLIKQGLFNPGKPTSHTSTPVTIGSAPNGIPLAAGMRAIYARAGALWSAPEIGPGIAQRLTPANIQIGGWRVSPDGTQVAYVDAQTGRIHTVRSDGQSDHVIGSIGAGNLAASFWSTSMGRAVADGLAWSPDGTQIAYVAVGSSDQAILCVMNADGTNDRTISNGGAAPVWSSDSLWIAYTASANSAQSILAYDLVSRQTHVLAIQADASDASATVAQLAWLPDMLQPTVTWAAHDGNGVTGIFTRSILHSAAPHRLTPTGMQLRAADFSTKANGGAWIIGGSSLAVLSVQDGSTLATITPATSVSAVAWSPDGMKAAFVMMNGALDLWTPNSAMSRVASGVVGAPVWSADGQWLAARQSNSGVVSMKLRGTSIANLYRLSAPSGAASLLWAPDGRSLIIATQSDMRIVARDGSQAKVVDTHAAPGSQIAWSNIQ